MTNMSGIEFAAGVREIILANLEAEAEWIKGELNHDEIWWWPGPAVTSMRVSAIGPNVPHLGALIVETYGGIDLNLEVARKFCSILNLSTSLTRWVILNDPLIPESIGARHDGRPVMCATNTFIFGGPEANLPIAAVELIVQEQIAKANALMLNGFFTPESENDQDPWCSLFVGRDVSEGIRLRELNDTCNYFDDRVLPYSKGSVEWGALTAAFEEARDAQLSGRYGDTGAWFGNGGPGGLTLEMPFEDRDWDGVITMPAFDPPAKTALVRCTQEDHTHLGNGILIRAQLPVTPEIERVDLIVQALNTHGLNNVFGTFHVLGTWVNLGNEPWFTAFVPASWSTLLEDQDRAWFYDQLLSNVAREVMAARAVLGLSGPDDPEVSSTSGLLAGERGRGYSYGEIPLSLIS